MELEAITTYRLNLTEEERDNLSLANDVLFELKHELMPYGELGGKHKKLTTETKTYSTSDIQLVYEILEVLSTSNKHYIKVED